MTRWYKLQWLLGTMWSTDEAEVDAKRAELRPRFITYKSSYEMPTGYHPVGDRPAGYHPVGSRWRLTSADEVANRMAAHMDTLAPATPETTESL